MNLDRNEGSKDWWDEKYTQSSDYLYGKEASTFLTENLHLLKKGETLDVAMGEGANACYLAREGFNVTGVDFSSTANQRAQQLATECNASIQIKNQDLDFFLIPLMSYQNILLFNVRPPITVFKNLARGLTVGGHLIAEGFTMKHVQSDNPEKIEAFECFKPNELLNYVKDLHIIFYNEQQLSNNQHRVQLIAQKVGM